MALRLEDYSDRELLYALERASDSDGAASSADVARELGITTANPHHSVAVRFGWLRRYGVLEREEDGRWALTDDGAAVVRGRLRARAERALEELGEEELWLLSQRLTSRYAASTNAVAATLVARQWRHGLAVRKRTAR